MYEFPRMISPVRGVSGRATARLLLAGVVAVTLVGCHPFESLDSEVPEPDVEEDGMNGDATVDVDPGDVDDDGQSEDVAVSDGVGVDGVDPADSTAETCACPDLPPNTECSATCQVTCSPGFADCNQDLFTDQTDGCESDLGSSESCGACGVRCEGAQYCNPARQCDGAVAAIEVSGAQACFLMKNDGGKDGEVWCADLENAATVTSAFPQSTSEGETLVASELTAGTWHHCARTSDAALYCWGYNESGEVNPLSDAYDVPPTQIELSEGVLRTIANRLQISSVSPRIVAVDAGPMNTCVAFTAAPTRVVCWGAASGDGVGPSGTVLAGDRFELGLTSGSLGYTAGEQVRFEGIDGLAASTWRGCSKDRSGFVACWETETEARSHDVGDGLIYQNLDAGRAHACVRDDDGLLSCFGEAKLGQFAAQVENVAPQAPVAQDVVRDFALQGDVTCSIIRSSGDIFCQGSADASAILGQPIPQDETKGPWTEIDLSASHLCAIANDEQILCWTTSERSVIEIAFATDTGSSP